ncbi:MAG TPA: TolC family protein [Cyclobacteriaceae bacterium]|nr:TolC family protein [Cyclobacteriaceae bacterium]
MKRFLLLAIPALLITQGAMAQEPRKLTLQECVKIALENNLKVVRGVYNVESYEINLRQNRMAFLPSLNFGAGYGKNYGRALNPVSNLYVNRNSNTINIQGSSSVTLFNGLRITNTFRSSQRDYASSNLDLTKAKNDVILNVVTNYTTVILNRELYENARFQLESSNQQLERIKKQVNAGALPLSNQYTQEAQVATNEVNLINNENALNLSVLQLKQSMQVPASTAIEPVIPELQLDDTVLPLTPDDIYQLALVNMPEVKSAVLKVESADLALKATQGGLFPRLTLNGSAQSNYSSISDGPLYSQSLGTPGTQQIGYVQSTGDPVVTNILVPAKIADNYNQRDQLKDNLFKNLSLQLSIPVFNGLQTRTNVQRALVSKRLADITVQETQNTLRQSIETSYNDALAAAKTYAASLKSVKAQEEAYRMNKQRFELGALSFVEYHVSENDLFRTRSDLSRAKYNFIFKKKILDFYQGKQIDF